MELAVQRAVADRLAERRRGAVGLAALEEDDLLAMLEHLGDFFAADGIIDVGTFGNF